jgi:hypothetical protein
MKTTRALHVAEVHITNYSLQTGSGSEAHLASCPRGKRGSFIQGKAAGREANHYIIKARRGKHTSLRSNQCFVKGQFNCCF